MIRGLRELADYWDVDTEESRKINEAIAEIERLRKELNGDGLLTLQDQVDHARDYIAELITKYDDMTSIALRSTRRLPRIYKDFAYNAIDANTGGEVERV